MYRACDAGRCETTVAKILPNEPDELKSGASHHLHFVRGYIAPDATEIAERTRAGVAERSDLCLAERTREPVVGLGSRVVDGRTAYIATRVHSTRRDRKAPNEPESVLPIKPEQFLPNEPEPLDRIPDVALPRSPNTITRATNFGSRESSGSVGTDTRGLVCHAHAGILPSATVKASRVGMWSAKTRRWHMPTREDVSSVRWQCPMRGHGTHTPFREQVWNRPSTRIHRMYYIC